MQNSVKISAQNSIESELEEIPINVRVERMGGVTLNSLYEYETGNLLLPVTEFFNFLQIKAVPSASLDSISGFLVKEENHYVIDNRNKKISFAGKDYPVNQNQLMTTGTDLFMDTRLFGEIFGLNCQFNFRSLSVTMKPSFELPAIREMKLQQYRKNIDQLKGQIQADTTLNQEHNLWRFGMVDWAFNSTQSTAGSDNTQLWLRTGAQLLGGEANMQVYHSTTTDFGSRNLDYYWRWVDNEKKAVRQVRAGRIAPSSISSIYDPVDGISVTNASTRYRRSFGEYTITNYTEPGWTVELYVNNVIVDYQTADASGLYIFNVPLVYGSTEVMLKFYGPYGEERIQRQYLNIPFNFLPKGELEYNVSYGTVLNTDRSQFAKAEARYGVTRHLTVGGGLEYLSSITSGKEIPFLNASIAPFRNFLVSAEYAKGVRTNALASYRLPSGLSMELDYTRYTPGQQAILVSYQEERKATLSLPLRSSNFNVFSRFSFRQNVYTSFTYNNADITLTSYIRRVNLNLSAYANWMNGNDPNIYGNFGLGLPTWWGLTTRLQSQFDFTNQNVVTLRAEFEKRISQQGYLSLVGENNFQSDYRALTLAFRWTLPFSQVNLSTRLSNNDFMTTEGAQGSFGFGSGNGYVHTTDRPSVGTGGLTIVPFVDIDHNGKREDNEPLAPNLAVRLSGGRIIQNSKDSLIRIVGLEPYTDYLLTLDDKSLEQISYRIVHKNIRVFVSPNGFRKIDVPILPMGEVNGWVFMKEKNGRKGQERMLVNFYAENGEKVASTQTETDGGFTYLGLAPGHYLAQVDSLQLARLGMTASVADVPFEIKPDVLGDIVYDLQLFVEKPAKEKDIEADRQGGEKVAETQQLQVSTITDISETVAEEFYSLQMGSFRNQTYAEQFADMLKYRFGLPVWVDYENKLYKVRMGKFADREAVDEFRRSVWEKGFEGFPVLKKK
ncbi:SPOR domain-containing protein [Seramator thermalis]|uniref:SPOR domain-containing protein n=1 Tax=Seramator thermalis TaxID=2496270 RepID=UPI00101C8D44|nr:SPOR domain-containing protein [Seramator thermalis]